MSVCAWATSGSSAACAVFSCALISATLASIPAFWLWICFSCAAAAACWRLTSSRFCWIFVFWSLPLDAARAEATGATRVARRMRRMHSSRARM